MAVATVAERMKAADEPAQKLENLEVWLYGGDKDMEKLQGLLLGKIDDSFLAKLVFLAREFFSAEVGSEAVALNRFYNMVYPPAPAGQKRRLAAYSQVAALARYVEDAETLKPLAWTPEDHYLLGKTIAACAGGATDFGTLVDRACPDLEANPDAVAVDLYEAPGQADDVVNALVRDILKDNIDDKNKQQGGPAEMSTAEAVVPPVVLDAIVLSAKGEPVTKFPERRVLPLTPSFAMFVADCCEREQKGDKEKLVIPSRVQNRWEVGKAVMEAPPAASREGAAAGAGAGGGGGGGGGAAAAAAAVGADADSEHEFDDVVTKPHEFKSRLRTRCVTSADVKRWFTKAGIDWKTATIRDFCKLEKGQPPTLLSFTGLFTKLEAAHNAETGADFSEKKSRWMVRACKRILQAVRLSMHVYKRDNSLRDPKENPPDPWGFPGTIEDSMLGLKALPELPSDNTTIEPDAPAALMDDIHLPDEAALDGTPDAFRRAFAGAQEQRAKMADGGGREIQLVGPNVFKAARYLLRNELIIKGRHNRATRALPLLDDEARQSAFIKVKTTMQTSDVIANIETFTSHWCKLAAKGASKTDRGIILSGPPGTGKTTILQGLIDDSGFYNIVGEPLNGSSFNTSFVGQSEGLIRDVFARGKKLWWLPCGLIIDELEVMVPTRFGDKESRESKVDMLITLLDTFQGGNDVPNVYCFGATNRQNTIDEAFLRRLEGKFYVGLLEPASRREFLKNKMAAATADFSHASDETQPSTFDAAGDGWLTAAVHMTTGFSGGKVAELIKYVNREFEGHNEVVSWDGFVRACTELCVRENIYFAEKVLPVYLKDRQSCGVQVATAMREAENSTGKVFIDLSKEPKRWREVHETRGAQVEFRIHMEQFEPLGPGEVVRSASARKLAEVPFTVDLTMPIAGMARNVTRRFDVFYNRVLAGLAVFASEEEVTYVRVLNAATMRLIGKKEEKAVVQELDDTFKEATEYKKSMIIIDIASLAILDGGGGEGSVEPKRAECYSAIMSRFRTVGQTLGGDKQTWVVILSTHREFSNQFFGLSDYAVPPKVTALQKHKTCHFCKSDFKYFKGRDKDKDECAYHGTHGEGGAESDVTISGRLAVRVGKHKVMLVPGAAGAAAAAGSGIGDDKFKYEMPKRPPVALPNDTSATRRTGQTDTYQAHTSLDDSEWVVSATIKDALPDDGAKSEFAVFPVDVTITVHGLKAEKGVQEEWYTARERDRIVLQKLAEWDKLHGQGYQGVTGGRCSDLQNWTWNCCNEQVGAGLGCLKRTEHSFVYTSPDF